MPELRNIAIVSHVDHGKTTLVDAMLRQAGTFGAHEEVVERVMDSGEQERERGITILAKNAAVRYRGADGGEVKVNIVDTPGHADFGGEVERGLTMVDGVLLLVDAVRGPAASDPVRPAQGARAALAGDPGGQQGRPPGRPHRRGASRPSTSCSSTSTPDDDQIDFPILYASARNGWAATEQGIEGSDLTPLFDAILGHVPAPGGDPEAPLQALVTNLDSSPYHGRLAICRVHRGAIGEAQDVALCTRSGAVVPARDRRPLRERGARSGRGRAG